MDQQNFPDTQSTSTLTPAPVLIPSGRANQTPRVYQIIAMIMEELGKQGIGKERTASQGGSFKYRGVDQVYEALNPLLSKHGLVILPRFHNRQQVERQSKAGGALFYTTVDAEFDFISIEDGSKHTVSTIGEAMDSGDKSTNKCMAVAYKYACFIAFCIPIEGEGDDPDAAAHEVQAKEPVVTREEAADAYLRAIKDMDEAKDVDGLKKVWFAIDWALIPEVGKTALQRKQVERFNVLKQPIKTKVEPKFDDDEIPF